MSLSPRCPSIKGGVRGPGRCAPACRSPEDVSLCGSYKEIRERGEFELSQSGYLRDWAPPPPSISEYWGKQEKLFQATLAFSRVLLRKWHVFFISFRIKIVKTCIASKYVVFTLIAVAITRFSHLQEHLGRRTKKEI